MPVGPYVANGSQFQVETATPGTYAQITDMVDFSGPENTAAEIDITNMDDTVGRQYVSGLVDRGSFSCTFHHDPANALQEQMFSDQEQVPPTVRNYRLVLPDGAGGAASGENHYIQLSAFVQSASLSGGTDAPVTISASFRLSGNVLRDQLTP